MSSNVEIIYLGGLRSQAVCGPNRTELSVDVPKDYGGPGGNPGPMDMLGVALGSCVMGVVGIVAGRCELDVDGASTAVAREMDTENRRIRRLAVTVCMPVAPPPEVRSAFEKAVQLCPVHHALNPDIEAPIEFRWGE